MSTRLFLLSPVLAGFTVLFLPCSAQDAAKVSLLFLSFPKAIEPVKVQLRVAEGKTLDIEAPSNEFSQPLDVDARGVWSVGETVDGPDGKPVFKEYGSTRAPVSPQQMLRHPDL